MNNRFGIHWSNIPIGEQLGKWALGMGGDCYLVMDGAHGWIPKIRETRPNAIIVHRHAVSNWMAIRPEDYAQELAKLWCDHQQYTNHIELECEPDIFPNFPGWGLPILNRLKYAAEWQIKVATELRKIVSADLVIHTAALAHERIDLSQWFAIWKPLMDVCDVLDMHCYWEKDGKYHRPGLYDPEESYHRAFRYRKIHDFLESQNYYIPMMVTECGNFAPNNSDYADELTYYFSELEKDADYMIGGCVFILKSNVHNWVNDLTRQPNIERFFERLGRSPKKNLPYPNGGNGMTLPEWIVDLRGTLKKHPTKKYAIRSLSQIDTIVVHHTGTPLATPEAIANWHVDHYDWPGAGYHVYIQKSGKVYLMNSFETESYHTSGHNSHTLALAFEGDFTKDSVIEIQVELGKKIVKWIEENLGSLSIHGHKDMLGQSTACPGHFPVQKLKGEEFPPSPDWEAKYKELREVVDGELNNFLEIVNRLENAIEK